MEGSRTNSKTVETGEPRAFRSAFIALVGRPNTGKSTLLNTILGEPLAVVTSTPQTTRRNLRGIYNDDDLQLVFVDTPGIHRGKHTFNESMVRESAAALRDEGLDLVCYLVDLARDFGPEEDEVARLVVESRVASVIVFNKEDQIEHPQDRIAVFQSRYPELKDRPRVVLSAIAGDAKGRFLAAIDPLVTAGPRFFPTDELTDSDLRFFAAEYVRKQIIRTTREEIPHASFVEITSYREEEGTHLVEATIHVETAGQRGIVVGKGGTLIRKIGTNAAADLRALTGEPAKITCHVKVSGRWRDNPAFLRNMGYQVR